MFVDKPEDAPEESADSLTENNAEGPEETPKSKSEASSKKSTVFFKEEDIPEEHRAVVGPTFKRMQASHTRAMQKVAKVAHKAAAFDELTSDPAFKEWVASQNGSTNKKGPDDSDASGEPVRAIIREEIEKAIGPIKEETTNSKIERARTRAKFEWDKLVEDHPDVEEYREDMADLREQLPTASFEHLYKIASHGNVEATGGKKVLESMESKKRANIGKPTGQAPKGEPKQAKTVQEAAEQARAELLRKG